MSSIPLCIRFNNMDGFIKIYDETRYLVLFSYISVMKFVIESNIL